jgi:hypothetical protein
LIWQKKNIVQILMVFGLKNQFWPSLQIHIIYYIVVLTLQWLRFRNRISLDGLLWWRRTLWCVLRCKMWTWRIQIMWKPRDAWIMGWHASFRNCIQGDCDEPSTRLSYTATDCYHRQFMHTTKWD